MNFFTILSIFAPLVACVAVDLSGSGSEICRLECKQSYDLCMSQSYRDHRKVPECLESVCSKYHDDCPNCGYCNTLDIDVRDEVSVLVDAVEEVSVAECQAGMHCCSPDGSKIWKCSIFGPGWHWAFQKACGHAGCCSIGPGQTPICSC